MLTKAMLLIAALSTAPPLLPQTKFVGIREAGARPRRIYHSADQVRFEVRGLGASRVKYEASPLTRVPGRSAKFDGALDVVDGQAKLSVTGWPKGMWEVRVSSGEFETTARFALVDKPRAWTVGQSERHPAGMVARASVEDLEAMHLLGIRSVHVGLPIARMIPTATSELRFPPELDEFLDRARDIGVSVALKYSSFPGWLAGRPDEQSSRYPPTDYQRWRQIVEDAAKHYQNLGVRIWLLANEPDGGGFFKGGAEAYIRFVRETAPAIRQVQPRAVIVGPEVYSGDTAFMNKVLAACGNEFDVLSFHKPQHPWGAPYIAYMRLRDVYMPGKPLWNTEGENRTEMLPGYAVSVIRDLGHGTPKYYGYAFNTGVQNMFDRLGRANEYAVEFRALSDLLDDAEYVSCPDLGDNLELYFFQKSSGEVFAVGWANVIPERIFFRTSKSSHTLSDRFGNPYQVTPEGGLLGIQYVWDPIYIFGFDEVPRFRRDPKPNPNDNN